MTTYRPENPLIVQGDQTILVEVDSPRYLEARDHLARFAELVKSPEHVHTYRMTPLSIWNACAAGVSPKQMVETLLEFSKYPVPEHISVEVRDYASRYGRIKLRSGDQGLILAVETPPLAQELAHNKHIIPFLARQLSDLEFLVEPIYRGQVKQALIKIGFPAEDLAGYTEGEKLSLALRETMLKGEPFSLRDYQREAGEIFYAGGSEHGGSGVIVLPCGAGKTIVGLSCIAQAQSSTLILTTNVTASRQWISEILDKTTLHSEMVGEYNGTAKDIKPITVATYNILTWRASKESDFIHLKLFDQRNWGLIIYDEVHLLPAPVFQVTAGIQARRRLGLTATLVREDGREDDVFALIGPKKVDIPWKVLEGQGWIARATCSEIRLPLPEDLRMPYAVAEARQKFRIASENPDKLAIVKHLIEKHPDEPILVISMYVDQLKAVADPLGIPIITGSTSQKVRDKLYEQFKTGEVRILAVSKVANFAIDLPDASVAIQISGTFGSRQEEAQRLGRILRPKPGLNQAHFYTLVTRETTEQDFAHNRQLFLCEQGYEYHILDAEDLT